MQAELTQLKPVLEKTVGETEVCARVRLVGVGVGVDACVAFVWVYVCHVWVWVWMWVGGWVGG